MNGRQWGCTAATSHDFTANVERYFISNVTKAPAARPMRLWASVHSVFSPAAATSARARLRFGSVCRQSDTAGWVNLEGPPPIFNGGPVRLRMTVRSLDGGNAVVTYEIGGETYMFDGHSEIPVVVSSSLVGAEFSGEGRILSLGGTRVKATSELSLIVR